MNLKSLINNHVLTNLLFGLVLIIGISVYNNLPREQDPSINFNWVQLTTFLPGASAEDVETKVTDVLEEVIETVKDIKFVSSTSRETISSILVRFEDISATEFDKRVSDLRREVQNVEDELPEEVIRTRIIEITSANAFPTATVVIYANAADENLRRQANLLNKDLARIKGVDQILTTGLNDPELQVQFDIDKLQLLGISPVTVSNSIRAFFKDVSAGSAKIGADQWLVRVEGTTTDPKVLAQIPILSGNPQVGEILLGDVAKVVRARSKAAKLVRFEGHPAVLFGLSKREGVNTLELVDRIKAFIDKQSQFDEQRGVTVLLADDQTLITLNALNTMQTNALYGLILVLLVTWLFLGSKISILVTIGIPFTLAGTFVVLGLFGQTLNTVVLLGVVIALGMLVDDAVVVIESIYNKLRRGVPAHNAVWDGLMEVIRPVTASVLTTIAAFMPLMLMPGIMGKFMMVVPLTVTVALLISLVEAYWMLPGHVLALKAHLDSPSKFQHLRNRYTHKLQIFYSKILFKVMRRPKRAFAALGILLIMAGGAMWAGLVKMDFFASDPLRVFYISIENPTTASLEDTMQKVLQAEKQARKNFEPGEVRSIVSFSGQLFTETAPFFGDHLGQVFVSLNPKVNGMRSVSEIIESMREDVTAISGPENISFLKLAGGPPASRAINLKVRGDNYQEIRSATDILLGFIHKDSDYTDVADDDSKGRFGLNLSLNLDAVNRTGIAPDTVYRTISMLVDGELVSEVREAGELVKVRVKSSLSVANNATDIRELLAISLPAADGTPIPLNQLVHIQTEKVKGNLRHYNFRRTITIEADIDKENTDTVQANAKIVAYWGTISANYPNINLDFTGELDDIQESMGALGMLLLLGVGVIYLILSTQFQSYFQPIMILVTVPMAFIGVVLGLIVSGNPLSLFTMYGIVALVGISVNASIVLISTANTNLEKGMSLIHATFFAAKRRVLPITITVLTTMGGLLSLSVGLGGSSLIFGPVATAIVWGLAFSSVLTMFMIPVLYQATMKKAAAKIRNRNDIPSV